VLETAKNACKTGKKTEKQPYQKNDISVDGKSKNCGTAGKKNKVRRENKRETRSIFSRYKRSK
jgi:hypothetical protein